MDSSPPHYGGGAHAREPSAGAAHAREPSSGGAHAREPSSGGAHAREPSSGDQPSTDRDSSQHQQQHPPPVAPPHMMYNNYPPGMGYSGGQYHNPYPPPPPHGYAPYPNQPPQGYNYGPQYYNPPPVYHASRGGRGFCRGFIFCSCLIFTTIFFAGVFMAMVLHPKLPLYSVTSLSVEDFSTEPKLTGDWNISIGVENPNHKLRGFYSDLKMDLVWVNEAVAECGVPNFELGQNEKKQIDLRALTRDENGMSFEKWELDMMAKERESGSLMFNLRLSSTTSFKSSSVSTREALVVALCQKLKVVFQNKTGSGSLDNGGKPVTCSIFM